MNTNYTLQINKNKKILEELILNNAPYNKILKQSQLLDIYIAKQMKQELNLKSKKRVSS